MTTPLLRYAFPALHPGQQIVAESKARFRVVVCGRRWGKTKLGIVLALKRGLEGGRVWWISPTYPLARSAWNDFAELGRQIPGCDVREGAKMLVFPGRGLWIQIRSGDDPDSLRGEGLNLAVLDEAALLDARVWREAIRPALTDRKGGALFLTTPKGMDYVYDLFQMGQDPAFPEYESFHFVSANNPMLDPAEIAFAKEELPSDVFSQEYLAEFFADAAAVFRGVNGCFAGEPIMDPRDPAVLHCEPVATGDGYVTGWDIAKHTDFNFFVVLRLRDRRLVYAERSNKVDFEFQLERAKTLSRRYPGFVIMDATGAGDPIYERARYMGIPVKPYVFTSRSKADLVLRLAASIEKRELSSPAIPVLVNELRDFRYEILGGPLRTIRYSSTPGKHDDGVMALGLANSALFPDVRSSIGADTGKIATVGLTESASEAWGAL